MNIDGKAYRTIWLDEADRLHVIDQHVLPHRFETATITSFSALCDAIRNMLVRGAGLIGATAGYGMWLAACEAPAKDTEAFDTFMSDAATALKRTRPTASNLAWAVDRQLAAMTRGSSPEEKRHIAKVTAQAIADEDAEACKRIGEHGKTLLEALAAKKANGAPVNILTHCNAGWLAFVDYGSALSPVYAAHNAGLPVHVWVDETRPRNQGASLTAWELSRHGVPHALIADNAGGHLMQHGQVDIVIVGADRVTRRGDAANKIGTYLKALAAHDNGVPFYVALPSSTFDFSLDDGVAEIPIEERGAAEVRIMSGKTPDGSVLDVQICPDETPARNWAFDVTPNRLITGLISERGVCQATQEGIDSLYPESAGTARHGVVKYQASHTRGDVETSLRTLPAGIRETALDALTLFPELDAARTALHDAGLIGVYPSGIGYGNVSLRLAGNLFLISGSGTGSSRLLGKQGYSLVRAFDPLENTVASFGPVQASSESMTHGAVYGAANKARCVIHIHSPFLFTSLLAEGFPRTPESVAYGTPALSREVARLITEELSPSEGIFVTAGHNEGVFAYGESIASTLNLILSLNMTKD